MTTGVERDGAGRLVYRGRAYGADEFERQFNPRAALAAREVEAAQARRAQESEAVRARLDCVPGEPYGESERQVIDVFPARAADAPLLLVFHGGYWRAGHGRENSFIAEPFVATGATVMVASYDLCPAVGVADIVDQAARAIQWAQENAARFGGDPAQLFLMGHSAGAHLVAMALSSGSGEGGSVAGAVLVSGIYDLAPVLHISVNTEIGLRAEEAAALSPLALPMTPAIPRLVAWGGAEPEEWRRQSELYADAAEAAGAAVARVAVPGANHYDVFLGARAADHPLTVAALGLMAPDSRTN